MKRTLLFLFLAISASMGAWAQVKIDGIYYNLNEEEKTAEVIKPLFANDYLTIYSGDIVIPASVTYEGKDYAVTSLGNSAFSAFYDITSIVLPTSLKNIGESAFSSCIGLYALEIPEGVETIGKRAFSACINLTSMVIPNSVDSIGQSAFSHCNALESVKFGSGLRSVGRALFEECANITTVEISNDNPYLDSREGCNAIIETSTNKLVAGCNATVVPSSVKSIASGAFMYCNFTSFELPEGLEEIEKTAFYTCRNLKEITIPASVKSLGYAFYHCASLESLKVHPDNKVYDSRENCNAVIETATNQLILGCKTSFIPEGVTSIGDAAFSGYWDLSSIELPSSLTSIGIEAFTSCGLTSVTIPDGVTTIGVAVFSGCRALKTISLPQSLTSIGLSEFSSWDALSSIYVYANQPPTATGQGHLATDVYNRCTLYVPKGSEEAYADAEGWKDFKDIVAIPDEMIDNGIAINETNFPDINFRNWVLEVLECGADGVLKDVEITDVTRIVVTEKGIQNLKGIEYFTALKELYCNGNQLTSLDVSKNRVLKELYCYDNQLTSLDVSQNTALENLKCYNNRLTSLNVSECTALTKIECYQNQLKGAEVDALVESLSITNGKMYAIHIENEQNAMTTVQVAAASAKGWLVYNFDGNSWNEYFVEIAIINETNFPDENFRNWVLSQDYGDDGVLTNVEIAKVTRIDVSNKGIQNLKGIEYFTGLTDLNCASNRLTTLDVSKNTGLKTLICFGNPLTSLDLSGCTVLKDLWCYSNQIKGKEMDALVESLPTVDWGTMYAILSENEQNVMTTTQVAAAKAKGWRVYYYDRYDWFVYAGSEPAPQNEYLPFVAAGKSWTINRVTAGQDKLDKIQYNFAPLVTEDHGVEYYTLSGHLNIKTQYGEPVLMREENRKVFLYDSGMNNEFLVFDFSLKVGETYETYSYDESKMITYKVLSVGDYREGPEVIYREYDEKGDSMKTYARYLRKWVVERIDKPIQKTWIEGVGSLEGPLANLYDARNSDRDYLIHVSFDDGKQLHNLCWPLVDTMNYIWKGQVMPIGAEDNWEEDHHHQLTYELDGDCLHVYGKVYINCGGGFYVYFKEEPTDDPLVHRLRLSLWQFGLLAECEGLHATNFYVSGFNPNLNYIVVDNQGVEHPVINKTPQNEYRQFVEEGKIWIVKVESDGWPKEEWMEYYYLDGDTIIGGQTAKKMMCVKGESLEYSAENIDPIESVKYIGAWYEQDKKVYFAGKQQEMFELLYDFTLATNDSILFNGNMLIVNKVSGGIQGFKGTYYEIGDTERWLEGVGSETFPHANFRWNGNVGALIACTVDDEVIYLNEALASEIETADPDYAKKRRFDFNHTVKTQPKAPGHRSEEAVEVYGEYNSQQLNIVLGSLDDSYLVCITDQKTGQTVYKKAINAGNIVALSIDISKYPEGQYEITIENRDEVFNGVIDTASTGIENLTPTLSQGEGAIYNLQGQRIKTLQKGLNIVDGKKIYVR